MAKIVHFEIPADDPAAAQAFYGGVFGWQFAQFGGAPYWSINAGAEDEYGINGGLIQKNGPDHPVTVVIGVDDVEAYGAKIEAAGGTIVVPKMAIPGVGYCIYFKDPEGHIVGIYHNDPSAS